MKRWICLLLITLALVLLLMGKSIYRWGTPLFSQSVEHIDVLTYFYFSKEKFSITREELESSEVLTILQEYECAIFNKSIVQEPFSHDTAYSFIVTYLDGQTELFEYTESPDWVYRYVRTQNDGFYKIVLKDSERKLLDCLKLISSEMEDAISNF